ncbi:hypothetical protein SAVIM40S_01445 [Streptomyces avidinii]|uniref:Uncharacterized protein n=1 Tax=Streptomyces avidinii TaxID=1895 RepID=A0ABS4L6M5_STRAV|nr:hypothetical protein [Streptomyces avidinii]
MAHPADHRTTGKETTQALIQESRIVLECADEHSIMEVPRRLMAGKTVIDCTHGGMRQRVTTGCLCDSS